MKSNRTLLIKALIYRPYSEVITFIIAWIITGCIELSLAIGLANLLTKILSYFIFDLFWNKFVMANYKPCVIWLTGLSGAGKSTIADQLCKKLKQKDVRCIILDGDEIRNAFNNNGFDKKSRIQHNINVGYMASLLEKQGYVVIVSLISPFKEAREHSRKIANKFIEVFIDTSLEICEKRDVKGLYKKARSGEINDFTGVTSPYEKPLNAELHIKTSYNTISQSADTILKTIK